MGFLVPLQERWILWGAGLFCVLLDFLLCLQYRRSPRELKGEFLSRILGSNFFLLYFAYRLALRLHYSTGSSAHWFSWLEWGLNVSPFLIFGLSYLIRVPAFSPARGFRERLFPFFCLLLPVGIYESESLGSLVFNGGPDFLRPLFQRFPIEPFGMWKRLSQSFLLLGNGLTLWGLFSLRKSFSIMAEAREFIRHGPYRWVRHPVYLGESLATIGWFILKPSGFSLFLTF